MPLPIFFSISFFLVYSSLRAGRLSRYALIKICFFFIFFSQATTSCHTFQPSTSAPAGLVQFTCFNGAKVQILTQKTRCAALLRICKRLLPLALLALLVQKYKYWRRRRAALLDALLRIYKRLLPLWGDYLTCSGVIRCSQ
jgi:hypothetical protein